MRYEIGMLADDQGRVVPWLIADVGECTMDCVSDANVSGAHRAGCGLMPVAPVHELRVAWQKNDRWRGQVARASALMQSPGNRVVAVYADGGGVHAYGEAVGYADFPTVVIRKADGTQVHWSPDLVRSESEMTPECAGELEAGKEQGCG